MIYIDKILHFLVGFLLGTLFLSTGWWSMLIVAGIGVAKELYDKFYDKEKFDIADLAATIAGGFIANWLGLINIGL